MSSPRRQSPPSAIASPRQVQKLIAQSASKSPRGESNMGLLGPEAREENHDAEEEGGKAEEQGRQQQTGGQGAAGQQGEEDRNWQTMWPRLEQHGWQSLDLMTEEGWK